MSRDKLVREKLRVGQPSPQAHAFETEAITVRPSSDPPTGAAVYSEPFAHVVARACICPCHGSEAPTARSLHVILVGCPVCRGVHQ